jgi:hypothetical protein
MEELCINNIDVHFDTCLFTQEDVMVIILGYVSIKDLFNVKIVNMNLNDIISNQLDEIIYVIASRHINTFFENNKSNLFNKYYRGKSYDTYNSNKLIDIPFLISKTTYVLCCFHVKANCDAVGIAMLTININLNYSIYIFQPEVIRNEEYTPDYYGWDGDDVNVLILVEQTSVPSIAKIRNNKVLNFKRYNKIREKRKNIENLIFKNLINQNM